MSTYNAETIKVNKVDMKGLNDAINRTVHAFHPSEEGRRFYISGEYCWWEDGSKFFLVDEECVGWTSKEPHEFQLWSQGERIHRQGDAILIDARYTLALPFDTIKAHTKSEQVTLKKAMGSRYNYNGRIIGNLRNVLLLVNGGALNGN